MAVGALYKGSLLNDYGMRDERCPHHTIILIEQHASEEIKMRPSKITNSGYLTGLVVSRDPATLDLIANTIGTDGIYVGARFANPFPGKCFAEEVLGQIASGIV